MTFQFHCPQGHILEGDPAWAGQQTTCPQCQTAFIIPYPQAAEQAFSPAFQQPQFPGVGAGQPAFDPTGQNNPNRIYHVPCPNGHELETPPEMFGQDVMCPHCGVQFNLREKDSVEYKRKKKEEQERRELKSGKAWLNWAVAIAVIVLLFIVFLIFSGI